MRLHRYLLEPTPAAGGGTDPVVPPVVAPVAADASEGFKAALKKHGDDASSFARTTYADNERLRGELATANGKAPKEGSIVLTGEEAKSWGHYKALGAPSDLKKTLDEHGVLSTDNRSLKREKLAGSAAGLHGYNAEVLGTLAEKLDLEIDELKDDKGQPIGLDGKAIDVKKGGKPVKVAFVKGATEADPRVRLDEYATANWGAWMPSLKPVVVQERPKPNGTPNINDPNRNRKPGGGTGAGNNGNTNPYTGGVDRSKAPASTF